MWLVIQEDVNHQHWNGSITFIITSCYFLLFQSPSFGSLNPIQTIRRSHKGPIALPTNPSLSYRKIMPENSCVMPYSAFWVNSHPHSWWLTASISLQSKSTPEADVYHIPVRSCEFLLGKWWPLTINSEFQWILCVPLNIRCRVWRTSVVEDPDSGIFSKSVVASFFPDLGQKGG